MWKSGKGRKVGVSEPVFRPSKRCETLFRVMNKQCKLNAHQWEGYLIAVHPTPTSNALLTVASSSLMLTPSTYAIRLQSVIPFSATAITSTHLKDMGTVAGLTFFKFQLTQVNNELIWRAKHMQQVKSIIGNYPLKNPAYARPTLAATSAPHRTLLFFQPILFSPFFPICNSFFFFAFFSIWGYPHL